jgi:hypothetical protein
MDMAPQHMVVDGLLLIDFGDQFLQKFGPLDLWRVMLLTFLHFALPLGLLGCLLHLHRWLNLKLVLWLVLWLGNILVSH